jgi:hypothetical protein
LVQPLAHCSTRLEHGKPRPATSYGWLLVTTKHCKSEKHVRRSENAKKATSRKKIPGQRLHVPLSKANHWDYGTKNSTMLRWKWHIQSLCIAYLGCDERLENWSGSFPTLSKSHPKRVFIDTTATLAASRQELPHISTKSIRLEEICAFKVSHKEKRETRVKIR